MDPCPWWSWWIRQTIFSDADPANNCNNCLGCHPCTYLSSDRGRYTSSGGDNSVSVGAMEINRRAGANRGNEAAQQRAAGRRSRRDRAETGACFYHLSLTDNTQCHNGRWQKAQVINFMFKWPSPPWPRPIYGNMIKVPSVMVWPFVAGEEKVLQFEYINHQHVGAEGRGSWIWWQFPGL